MDSPWLKRALAGAVALVVVVIALLLLWPRSPGEPATAAPRPARASPIAASAGAAAQPPAPAQVAPVAPEAPEEFEGDTPQCTTIVRWHRRNVPAWVIEDNMMAQGMKFDEADLACLTGAGVPDQILFFAEQNAKRPQSPVPR